MNEDVKMLSLDERVSRVRRAFQPFTPKYDADEMANSTPGYWVMDIYDDHLIACHSETDKCYRVGYTIADSGDVTFEDMAAWQQVEKEWLEVVGGDEVKTVIGGAVKALGDGKVGGYLVKFGDPKNADFVGDYFTKDTDFDIPADGSFNGTIRFNHGLDPVLKGRKLGTARAGINDVGVWVEGLLNQRDEYEQAIYKLIEDGKVGWSSAAAPHLVERKPTGKAYHVTSWPLIPGDMTITHTPADYRQVVTPLKSLTPLSLSELKADDVQPEAEPEGAQASVSAEPEAPIVTDVIEVVTDYSTSSEEGETMTAEVQERIDALETFQKSVLEQMEKVLKYVEDTPQLNKSGYVTQDGGKADAERKSFGDWLFAIKRGDSKRLNEVYNSQKALSEDVGANGGYVVPEGFQQSVFQLVNEASPLLARIERIPVNTPAGDWPSLDYYTAPTAGTGASAMNAGMDSSVVAEGGNYTERQPRFTMINWRVGKIGDFVRASNELVADSPMAIESLLRQLITVTITNKLEYYVLRGNGVNVPLGILNSPALVQITPVTNNVFAYADANAMKSRFKSVGGQGVWVMHPGTEVDLGAFEVGTGGAVWVANVAAGNPEQLRGYDILRSEHLPQTNNSGHVILIDPTAYKLFVRQDIAVAYSEHAAFTSGQGTWRFDMRCDGQPILKNAITLGDPQGGYTMSPFVSFND